MTSDGEPSNDVIVPTPPAKGRGRALSARVKVREPLAAQHLWAARHFARLAEERETAITEQGLDKVDLAHRSYVMAAVKFAVSFLEALVNEVYSDAADAVMPDYSALLKPLEPDVIPKLKAEWEATEGATPVVHTRLMHKYAKALEFAGKTKFQKADIAYKEAHKVIVLRDFLVHFKPAWHEASVHQNKSSKIHRKLANSFTENTQPIGDPWFPNKCLSAGCARWACDSVTTFAGQWLDRLDIPHTYETAIDDQQTP
ncbi:hypothetical protein [Antrihabitans stalactiti]|uniref:Uncharacterized protein n=1 Tax=Antrihabitans stalactiti TaxID=2584121 RepID=A0A848KAV0_9NOCA|nr:hypothetical protein [Antrihabitans stalactiti]NMN94816.1 hypothetical protein [Antrihabitans stalactiti]